MVDALVSACFLISPRVQSSSGRHEQVGLLTQRLCTGPVVQLDSIAAEDVPLVFSSDDCPLKGCRSLFLTASLSSYTVLPVRVYLKFVFTDALKYGKAPSSHRGAEERW